jgi:hypothetical protein
MKTITQLLLLFCFTLIVQLPLSYASSTPMQLQEQSLVLKQKKKESLSKKEKRKRMRLLRKKYKKELRSMNKAERQSFLEDRIEEEQLIPNPWFSLGLTFLVLGGIFLLIFMDVAIIAWMGAALALIGLGFLVVWIIQDMQRDY